MRLAPPHQKNFKTRLTNTIQSSDKLPLYLKSQKIFVNAPGSKQINPCE
jgi:hypothetical protein